MTDDFLVEPPDFSDTTDMKRPKLDEAWILKIIEVYDLPKEIKLPLVQLLLNTAAKTNILRSEIPMHLLHAEEIFRGYKIFVNSGKLDSHLKTLEDQIMHEFELQLCRSVEGWQGELLFTQRYEVRQSKGEQRKKRFLESFRSKSQPEEQQQ